MTRPSAPPVCVPYNYVPASRAQGCGGADMWSARGPLFCPAGFYCPSTAAGWRVCPPGHYCRKGSVEPTKCLPWPLHFCGEEGTEGVTSGLLPGIVCLGIFAGEESASPGDLSRKGAAHFRRRIRGARVR